MRPASAALLTWIAAIALAIPMPAAAQPPSDPACLPLAGGSTGLLAVGGMIPSEAQLVGRRGGFGPVVAPALAATLPEDVIFRTATETFSREYAFVLRDGRIFVRIATVGRAVRGEPWHELELPACLDGRVEEISADHRLLLAIGPDGQLYSHDMPGGDLAAERWTWRWGPYFWTGSGMRIPADVRDWAASEFTGAETFTDSSGRSHNPIGVATAYLLRPHGRITYIDPWLPNDESREVCGPRRGTVPLAGLSGSGSTALVVSRDARIYTRLYDFDVSGANTVFGDYSWDSPRPAADSRWQLPGPRWIKHSRPRGLITNRVSIGKTGTDAADRLLRVEGRERGRTGYFEKSIGDRGRAAWRFVETGEPLAGRPLRPDAAVAAIRADDRRYAGVIEAGAAELLDFNPECSPASLRIEVGAGPPLDLILHSSDGLRQETRPRGLDDVPREYNGAIEVPEQLFASLQAGDPRKAWIDANLGGERIATAPIAVTETRLRFLAQCWELTLDGDPARPDQPRVLPDLGAAVGRFTEQNADGRGLPDC